MIELWRTTDPLVFALAAAGAFALFCWVASLASDNYSQVDRLWSILPVLYVLHFAAHAGFADPRLDLMAALSFLWGARLTYNFGRKGGYRRGGEDYRWPYLRERLGPMWFQALNATFVAPFQNLLLLLLALPAYVAWQARTPLSILDGLVAVLFLVFWLGEAVADEQQWRFQSAKAAHRRSGMPVPSEFLTTGLFRYSRHPNFFCELGMWWTVYLFSVTATGEWLNFSIAGAALLTLLFQGSTWITEHLALRKYPRYRDYQRVTSRLLPWFPRGEVRFPAPSEVGPERAAPPIPAAEQTPGRR
jgi:steroid 5-alpha reductase family enzyme